MGAARGTVAVGVHVVVPSQVARGDRSDAATRMIRPDYSPAPLSASSAVVSSGSRSEPASTMASRFSLMGFEERRSRVATRPGRPYRCPSLHASTRPFAPTADGWLSAPIYRRLATSVEDAIQDRHRLDDSEPDRLSGPTFVPAVVRRGLRSRSARVRRKNPSAMPRAGLAAQQLTFLVLKLRIGQ